MFILYQTVWETIWNGIVAFFSWVSQSGAWMLFLCGLIVITWLGYERKRRGSFKKYEIDRTKYVMTKFLKFLSFFGLIVGILAIWAGVTALIQNVPPSFAYRDNTGDHSNLFTCVVLIVLGIVAFLKPINDLPVTSIVAFVVGGVVTVLVMSLMEPYEDLIGDWINPKLVLIIVFIVVTGVVGFFGKFFIKPLKWISNFLSWPLLAILIALFCFIQSVLLLGPGISLIG